MLTGFYINSQVNFVERSIQSIPGVYHSYLGHHFKIEELSTQDISLR